MKKAFAVGLLCWIQGVTWGQSTPCRTKLDSAAAILMRTHSFAEQIRGEKKDAYEGLLDALRMQGGAASSDFACFSLIAKLFDPIRDNHLAFYQREKDALAPADYGDRDKVKAFRSLPRLREFPRVTIHIDSLKRRLAKQPADSVEGIYRLDDLMQIGLYRTAKYDSLMAVVVSTDIPFWEKGEVVMVLHEFIPGHFRGIVAEPLTKEWNMIRNEKYAPPMLAENRPFGMKGRSVWTKSMTGQDYSRIAGDAPVYQLRSLDTSTQYLRLGSFATDTDVLENAGRFFDSVKSRLTASRLVLDLRNNGGGGFKNSRQFLNLLEQYARTRKIYVLINHRTMSNAEQFVILLKASPGVVLLGETTNGTVTYGTNQDHHHRLPGTNWIVYPTDLRGSPTFLKYEDVGIEPVVKLDKSRDWIIQVMEYISSTKPAARWCRI